MTPLLWKEVSGERWVTSLRSKLSHFRLNPTESNNHHSENQLQHEHIRERTPTRAASGHQNFKLFYASTDRDRLIYRRPRPPRSIGRVDMD